jgi:hypothetical protein
MACGAAGLMPRKKHHQFKGSNDDEHQFNRERSFLLIPATATSLFPIMVGANTVSPVHKPASGHVYVT